MINSWHCDNLYNTDEPPLMIEQTCVVTSSSTPPVYAPTTSPITVRDDGTMIFGLGIIIFFLSVFFFAALFGALGMKSKL